MPAYWHPVFLNLGHKRGECPNAEEYYNTEISLPMWPDLFSDSKLLNKVISVLKEA
jgi:dTDP-4-amino-4,6-dideoxygalactose transaminase